MGGYDKTGPGGFAGLRRSVNYGPACLAVTLAGLLLFAAMLFTACSPARQSAVTINASGAVVLDSLDTGEVRVRSYSPEMVLELQREPGSSAPVAIRLENVPAGALQATVVTPGAKPEQASVVTEVISPTVLQLQLEGGLGPQALELAWAKELAAAPLTFAIVGDNQGNNDVLARIIKEINASEASFVVHLGDMVPSGDEREYDDFLATMAVLAVPWFSVPGNHDVRGEWLALYEQLLAPRYYRFEHQSYTWLFLDNSPLGLDESQQQWLEEQLQGDKPALLFMHVPLYDPRGRGHSFLDLAEAGMVMNLLKKAPSGVQGVFAGHIHMFHTEQVEASTGSFAGQDAAATGGAGQDAAAPGEADQPAPAGMPSQNAPQVPRDAVLVITGTGLQQDVFLAAADLRFNNPALVERYYTSSNNWDFHKIWKVKGFDLFNLMGAENLKTDRDYPVTFQAADGLKYTETVSSLKNRCYHPEFDATGGKPVGPLIGVYRQAVFEPNYQGLPGEVSWADRQLTAGDRDDRAPRLYLGQKQGNPSDRNQSLFVRDLVRIVVGEERPAGGDAL